MNSARLRMGHSVCILLVCNLSLLLVATGELSVIERLESEAKAAAGRRERVVDAMEAQPAIAWMKLKDAINVEGGGTASPSLPPSSLKPIAEINEVPNATQIACQRILNLLIRPDVLCSVQSASVVLLLVFQKGGTTSFAQLVSKGLRTPAKRRKQGRKKRTQMGYCNTKL